MDDYFLKYLQDKKKNSDEQSQETLKLPFQTNTANNQYQINPLGNFNNNSNLKFHPIMHQQNMSLMNNQSLQIPISNLNPNNMMQNLNSSVNNPKILFHQNNQQRIPQNPNLATMNPLMNNINNFLNNSNLSNQANFLGLKKNTGNLANIPIKSMLNNNMMNINQQIPSINSMQNFPNIGNNMNSINARKILQFFK